jgi:hypothetical protein
MDMMPSPNCETKQKSDPFFLLVKPHTHFLMNDSLDGSDAGGTERAAGGGCERGESGVPLWHDRILARP